MNKSPNEPISTKISGGLLMDAVEYIKTRPNSDLLGPMSRKGGPEFSRDAWYDVNEYHKLYNSFYLLEDVPMINFTQSIVDFACEKGLGLMSRFFMRASGAQKNLARIPDMLTANWSHVQCEISINEPRIMGGWIKLPSQEVDWQLSFLKTLSRNLIGLSGHKLDAWKIIEVQDKLHQNRQWTTISFEVTYE
jgi:hypothetical protein